jgi:hypothetical protein
VASEKNFSPSARKHIYQFKQIRAEMEQDFSSRYLFDKKAVGDEFF